MVSTDSQEFEEITSRKEADISVLRQKWDSFADLSQFRPITIEIEDTQTGFSLEVVGDLEEEERQEVQNIFNAYLGSSLIRSSLENKKSHCVRLILTAVRSK